VTGAEGIDFSAMVLPAALFILTYAAIMTERVNRAVVALLGGGFAIAAGLLNQEEAIHAIDFNTLALLAGMMIIVGITKKSGLFGYVAIRATQFMRGSPAGILFVLPLITALFSALLDNVTTVLLIVPVTLVICSELHVRPYPYLFAEIFASNIGGTATLIGDPPNILIGSAVGLSFNDFLFALGPVIAVIFTLQCGIIHLIWGRTMRADKAHRARVMANNANEMIEDSRLVTMSLGVIALVLGAFVFARPLGLEAGTIALLGAAVLMLLDTLPRPRESHSETVTEAFHEVEWITIFFFVGLFIVVGSLEKAGILEYLSKQLLAFTGGDVRMTAVYVLWASAVLSAIVDNIPFVATMIPLISGMAPAMGGESAITPVWWALALGACLGGNGTLIGASANLTVAGIAEKNGAPIRFLPFMLTAFPLMLVSIAICHIYLLWRFF
jgi:Na+/H+ antiporter NhaD/arsenite permease-like protein